MRISIRGVRPEVLESTREAGKAVATRVRYDVLLNATPRSQWRACFMSPASYSVDDLPSRYAFGEKCISYECPQSEAARHFDQLREYIRQANARSQELEGLSRQSPLRTKASSPTLEMGRGPPADNGMDHGTRRDMEALGKEIETEVRGWPTGCGGDG